MQWYSISILWKPGVGFNLENLGSYSIFRGNLSALGKLNGRKQGRWLVRVSIRTHPALSHSPDF